MSKLKFRVFDPVTRKLTYFGIRECMGNLPLDIVDENITQWSGAYDKNGREIYAGDILRIHGEAATFLCAYNAEFAFVLVDSSAAESLLCEADLEKIAIVCNIFV